MPGTFSRWLLRIVVMLLAAVGAAALIVASLLAVPVRVPPELKSIIAGTRSVDRSELPELERYQARDGTELAFRRYQPATVTNNGIAVLVHGSAGNSANMHAVGKGLMAAGVRAVALDIRGHGRSGMRGDIGYVGQLEHDLADVIGFLKRSAPDARFALVGHSAGGGFALRIAGGAVGELFDRYVLVAPYLGPFAPTSRRQTGDARWAEPNIPRIMALAALERVGISCCQSLPTLTFALPEDAILRATTRYSYRLMVNFAAHWDYRSDLLMARRPVVLVSGDADELMDANKYEAAMQLPGGGVRTVLVPGINHMGVLADPSGIAAIVDAVLSPNPRVGSRK
jgi:alpha-beta hydrolase superfamily lysophospholipase